MDVLTSYFRSHAAFPLISAAALLTAGFIVTRTVLTNRPLSQFACRLVFFSGFTVVLVVADVVPFKSSPIAEPSFSYVAFDVFKIVWWLGSAWLVVGLVHAVLVFNKRSVETRFLQDLLAAFVYVGAVLGIIAYVFDLPVSGLLAASGVVAIVLGLALQSTLGDMFSGVVLNLAKPYRPGDWVILDDGLQGRVVDTSWRATNILTLMNDLAIVPNSVISKARLINASKPSEVHGVSLTVRLDPTVAPSIVIAILETALLSCNDVLRCPKATVLVVVLDAVALECELVFYVALIEYARKAQNEVFDRVFKHCASAGIRMAPPAASALVLPSRYSPPDPKLTPFRLLERLVLFATLSDAERQALAPTMRRRVFTSGDTVVEQDTLQQFLYVLSSGVLVAIQRQGDADVEIFRLAPGDCFAQESLLTPGATTMFNVLALTKAVVYEIDKINLTPLLKMRPAILAELSRVTQSRDAASKMIYLARDGAKEHPSSLIKRMLARFTDKDAPDLHPK